MPRRAAAIVPLLTLGAAAALRAEALPFDAALAVAGAVLLVALVLGWRRELPVHGAAGTTLLVASALALSGLAPDLWPCDVDCRGGEELRTLFGMPTLLWCAAATLLAGVLLAGVRRDTPGAGRAWIGELSSRACAGASIWFLAVALQLGMRCRLCFAVHLPILAAALLVSRGARTPSFVRVLALLCGALLTRQLYRIDAQRFDAPAETSPAPPPPPPPEAIEEPEPGQAAGAPEGGEAHEGGDPRESGAQAAALLAELDAGRRLVAAAPKLRAEIVVSFNCGHCSEEFVPFLEALGPLAAAGELDVRFRILHARKEPASRTLSKLAFAAGRAGRFRERMVATFEERARAVRAGPAGDGEPPRPGDAMERAIQRYLDRDQLVLDALRARTDGAEQLAQDEALVAGHAALFERMVQDEQRALAKLAGEGELPWIFLFDPADAAVPERLASGTQPAQLAALVRTRLAKR